MISCVRISRLRVTGGFLADLDVAFDPGLNVVIGPRGAGKTTLLELIRHALGTPHADKTRSERESKRVRSMLGNGEVVLDLEVENEAHRLVVDADGGGRRPELAGLALMLGQNELEAIASDAESRLRLIDLRAQLTESGAADDAVVALTVQLSSLREEMGELEDRTRQRPLLQADLEALTADESALMDRASDDMAIKRDLLRILEGELLAVQTQSMQAKAAITALENLDIERESIRARVNELASFDVNHPDASEVRAAMAEADRATHQIHASTQTALAVLQEAQVRRSQKELDIRGKAEPLRSELNDAERGLGELTARTRNIRSQLARLESDQARLREIRQRYTSALAAREAALDALEGASELRYRDRLAIATDVSQRLSARITVAIEHLADARAFRDFIATALQGSGLRYAAIADTFSKKLLPRQLLRYIEEKDIVAAAAATEFPEDRVARVLDFLDNAGVLKRLTTIQLEDVANFLLVDGTVLKSVEELSTGQKCAVTLPILLTEHSRALVLDQPEDHLDNAYLVDNIIVGLNSRSAASAQTIVATHNANIPVLGSAGKVFLLNSDGRRGFLSKTGSYDHPEIVSAITTLMEGGRDAFRKRALFYQTHGLHS